MKVRYSEIYYKNDRKGYKIVVGNIHSIQPLKPAILLFLRKINLTTN